MSSALMNVETPRGSVPGAGHTESSVGDPGLAVPVTPPRQYVLVDSPRASGGGTFV